MDAIEKPPELPVITITADDVPYVFRGVTRTRAYAALRTGELRAKKAGKATIIEVREAERWVRSLPDKEPNTAA